MVKAWTDAAWEDFEYWTREDKKTFRRILQLLKDIDRNGYEGIGKPERLSGDLAGYWSRRIDGKNRIVYRIDGNTIKIFLFGLGCQKHLWCDAHTNIWHGAGVAHPFGALILFLCISPKRPKPSQRRSRFPDNKLCPQYQRLGRHVRRMYHLN